MKRSVSTAVVVGVLAVAVALAGPVQADSRTDQTISITPLPELVVGQFHEVEVSASSGLPVTLTAEGPCQLRWVDGPPVVLALSAGQCDIIATQPGNQAFAPAPTVRSEFPLLKAETDVLVVIPGKDVVPRGAELKAWVSVDGEEGSLPSPSGSVGVIVRGPDGAALTTQTLALDTRGEALLSVPREQTDGWAAGEYTITATYSGDEGFLSSISDPLPFAVTPGSCGGPNACDDPGGLQGKGGISLVFSPLPGVAGVPGTVTARGFPENGVEVEFTVVNPRLSPDPIKKTVASRDGSASLTFDTGPKDSFGPISVKAYYSFYHDDFGYTDTITGSYQAHIGPADVYLWKPYQGRTEITREAGKRPPDPLLAASWVMTVKISGTATPFVTGVDPFGRPCPELSGELFSQKHYDVDVTSHDWCRITVHVPESDAYIANSTTFTFIAYCRTYHGLHPCREGGEPVENEDPDHPSPKGPITNGRTVVVDAPLSTDRGDAPMFDVTSGEDVMVAVSWPALGDEIAVLEWTGKTWARVGSARAGADGHAVLPVMKDVGAGVHQMKLVGDVTEYLNIRAS